MCDRAPLGALSLSTALVLLARSDPLPGRSWNSLLGGSAENVGRYRLGQEGAAIYVGAASMCPETQDDSCARRRLQGQSQEPGPRAAWTSLLGVGEGGTEALLLFF